jgi:hypothetical protein
MPLTKSTLKITYTCKLLSGLPSLSLSLSLSLRHRSGSTFFRTFTSQAGSCVELISINCGRTQYKMVITCQKARKSRAFRIESPIPVSLKAIARKSWQSFTDKGSVQLGL